MTNNFINGNTDTDGWIRWIEDGIEKEYINCHEYKFKTIERVGDGGFASVFRVTWEGSDTVVALKSLKYNDDNFMKEFVNEVTERCTFNINVKLFPN